MHKSPTESGARPCWLRRAVRNRHRHAIELASRRWRGGHDLAVAETRRENLIYAQVINQLATHLHVPPNAATLVILGMLGLVVNHVFACIWYYLGADDFSEECSLASVPARDCTWMQVHGLHPHRGNWYLYITCLYWSVMTLSTVGYGDISPNTTEEKIFTIVVISAYI